MANPGLKWADPYTIGIDASEIDCPAVRFIGQSKIIRRAAVTCRDPHTCCGLNAITRLELAPFFLAGIHHRSCSPFTADPVRFSKINCPRNQSGSVGDGEHSEHDEQCSPVFVVFGRTWRTHPLRGVRFVRLHVRSRLFFRGPCLVVPCSDVLLADQIFGCALKCLLPRSAGHRSPGSGREGPR